MADLDKVRMPAGSSYFVEVGHNGNGNIENSSDTSDAGWDSCIRPTGNIDHILGADTEVFTSGRVNFSLEEHVINLGHNGNGNIENSSDTSDAGWDSCGSAIEYDSPPDQESQPASDVSEEFSMFPLPLWPTSTK
jgi:hypothetical protein